MNGGQRWSMSARDGTFTFEDVPAGVYLVEVLSTTHHYSAVKVKVDDTTGVVALEYKVRSVHVGGLLFRRAMCSDQSSHE